MVLTKPNSLLLSVALLLPWYSSTAATIDVTVQSGFSCSFQNGGWGNDTGIVMLYHSTAQGIFSTNLGYSDAHGLWTAQNANTYANRRAPVGSRYTMQSDPSGRSGSVMMFEGRFGLKKRLWTCYTSISVIPPALSCNVSQIRPIDLGTVNVGESVSRNASTPITITCNAPATTSASIQTLLQLEGQAVELTMAGKPLGLKPTVIARAVSSTTVDIGAIIRDKSFSSVGVKSAHTVLVLTFD